MSGEDRGVSTEDDRTALLVDGEEGDGGSAEAKRAV